MTLDKEDVVNCVSWLCGWLGVAAVLHWWVLGWSWWWVLPLAIVPSPAGWIVCVFTYALVCGVCGYVAGTPMPAPARQAPVVMDERTKKLFVQLDDPMPGQRSTALEMLRARLLKNGRTFRDLLHELEGG